MRWLNFSYNFHIRCAFLFCFGFDAVNRWMANKDESFVVFSTLVYEGIEIEKRVKLSMTLSLPIQTKKKNWFFFILKWKQMKRKNIILRNKIHSLFLFQVNEKVVFNKTKHKKKSIQIVFDRIGLDGIEHTFCGAFEIFSIEKWNKEWKKLHFSDFNIYCIYRFAMVIAWCIWNCMRENILLSFFSRFFFSII